MKNIFKKGTVSKKEKKCHKTILKIEYNKKELVWSKVYLEFNT